MKKTPLALALMLSPSLAMAQNVIEPAAQPLAIGASVRGEITTANSFLFKARADVPGLKIEPARFDLG